MQNFKSFLLLSLAFGVITTASGQPSQNSDTIVLNKEQALKVLAKALEANVLAEQVEAYKQDVDSLNAIIKIKQKQLTNLSSQISNYKQLAATYKNEINALNSQKSLYEKQVASLTKQIKKERRKKRWLSFAGSAAIGILTYLYITK